MQRSASILPFLVTDRQRRDDLFTAAEVRQVEALVFTLNELLTGTEPLADVFPSLYREGFALRQLAQQYVARVGLSKDALLQKHHEVSQQLQTPEYPQLSACVEQALDWLDASNRLVLEGAPNEQPLGTSPLIALPTYEQVIASLYAANFPEPQFGWLVGWINESLVLEVALAAALVLHGDIKLRKSRVNELAQAVSDQLDRFAAYAALLGIRPVDAFDVDPRSVRIRILVAQHQLNAGQGMVISFDELEKTAIVHAA